MAVKINQRFVGDQHSIFITCEAGPTHDGVGSAKRLIDHAAMAGADAIKFQIIDADRLVADKEAKFEYQILLDKVTNETKTVSEKLYDLLKRRSLSESEWKTVKNYADKAGVGFFATAAFPDEIDFLMELGCDSIKIASADVNHFPLLRYAAKTGINVQLDTGSATIGEIEAAVEVITSEGNDNIIIHHCPSGYPARRDGINLNIIKTLKSFFDFPIAFSDHSSGWAMDIAAVALGANLIEKTISEDRLTNSIEHMFSIEPHEMSKFVNEIHELEVALGNKRRVLSNVEKEKRVSQRRSAFLLDSAKEGSFLGDLKIEFRRPGDGLSPDEVERFSDKKLVASKPTGAKLFLNDFC